LLIGIAIVTFVNENDCNYSSQL